MDKPACFAMMEPLESRAMLSSAWPNAPFPDNQLKNTIYANQYGDATLNNQAVKAGAINKYLIYFDDPGPVVVKAVGRANMEIAFYNGSGKPVSTGATVPRKTVAHTSANIESKTPLYIAVRAQAPRASAVYSLRVYGVPQGVIWDVPFKPGTNVATKKTTISSPWDADFMSFTTTQAGNWQVKIGPVLNLDVWLNVYDRAGNPIGGTYSSTINSVGDGKSEYWTGKNIPAGTQIFIRIGGFTADWAIFHVRAMLVK